MTGICCPKTSIKTKNIIILSLIPLISLKTSSLGGRRTLSWNYGCFCNCFNYTAEPHVQKMCCKSSFESIISSDEVWSHLLDTSCKHFQSLQSCCAAPFTASASPHGAARLDTSCTTGGLYAHHNVAELTLCLWLATATVQHRFHNAKLQNGHKNTDKEGKRDAWLMPSFELISATRDCMIADYLWLSVQFRGNCFFCAYLMEGICLSCHFGMDLQQRRHRTKCFSVLKNRYSWCVCLGLPA